MTKEELLGLGRLRWWALEIEAEARRLRVWNGSEDGVWGNGERGMVMVMGVEEEEEEVKSEKRAMKERNEAKAAMDFGSF